MIQWIFLILGVLLLILAWSWLGVRNTHKSEKIQQHLLWVIRFFISMSGSFLSWGCFGTRSPVGNILGVVSILILAVILLQLYGLRVWLERIRKNLYVSRTMYERVFENLPLGLFLLDSNLRIIKTNESALENMEVQEHQNFLDLVHPDDRSLYETSQKTEHTENEVLRVRLLAKEKKTLWTDLQTILIDDGYLLALRYKGYLHELRQTLFLAEAAAHFGSWSIDLQTGVHVWSPGVFHVLDIDPDQKPTGDLALERVLSEDQENLYQIIQSEGTHKFSTEVRILNRLYDLRHILVEGRLYKNSQGEPETLAGILYDVTTFRRYEKELEDYNEDLKQYTSIISHDLREPLRHITNHLGVFKQKASARGLLDKELQRHLEYAVQGALRVTRMISDLREYTQMVHDDAVHPLAERISITQCFKEALYNLRLLIQEKGVIISGVACEHNTPLNKDCPSCPHVTAPKILIIQVLMNLLENAIKFNPKPNPRVDIFYERTPGFLTIFFRDYGCGIAQPHWHRIFDMFYRVNLEIPGNGMGLAFCRRGMRRLGGEIYVHESFIGQGTTMAVRIPKTRHLSGRYLPLGFH